MTSTKTRALRELLTRDSMGFLMEAHNGMSAKVAEEAGFEGLWGSGLSISASMGVRDNNEMSWTQVLDLLEFVGDATTIPLLLDGDTGYGNFNNMRRLVQKLETRDIAGVCIEDKLFPKTNSFIGDNQPLADMDEFCGKIKAGKDAQRDDNFSIVARVEALIAGWGLGEALKRAEAYRRAGADAILIHSKLSKPDEILAFMAEWGDRGPVVIVPTTYYSTPTQAFRDAGVSVVIWANHSMRSALTAMQQTAQQLREEESLLNVEDRIVTVREVFRIQGASELEEAEKRYLPARQETPQALILAAGRGKELGVLTEDRPKAMVEIAGKPLLERTVDTLHSIGIKDITVVRGYRKEALQVPDLKYVDNDEHETTQEAFSLFKGLEGIAGPRADGLRRRALPEVHSHAPVRVGRRLLHRCRPAGAARAEEERLSRSRHLRSPVSLERVRPAIVAGEDEHRDPRRGGPRRVDRPAQDDRGGRLPAARARRVGRGPGAPPFHAHGGCLRPADREWESGGGRLHPGPLARCRRHARRRRGLELRRWRAVSVTRA